MDEKKPFICPNCGKKFRTKGYLKIHYMTHTDERPYKCPNCDKRFRTSGQLSQHELTHSQEKRHECYDCGKKFSLKGNLKAHILIHMGEKPHVCSYCGRGFTRRGSLKRHELIHLITRPHHCDAIISCNQYKIRIREIIRHYCETLKTYSIEKSWMTKIPIVRIKKLDLMSYQKGESRRVMKYMVKEIHENENWIKNEAEDADYKEFTLEQNSTLENQFKTEKENKIVSEFNNSKNNFYKVKTEPEFFTTEIWESLKIEIECKHEKEMESELILPD